MNEQMRLIPISAKEKIIDAYSNDQDWIKVSKELNIKLSTAQGIINRWQKTGRIANGKMGGHKKPLIGGEAGEKLIEYIQSNVNFNIRGMQSFLLENYGVKVSMTTIYNFISGKCVLMRLMRDYPNTKSLEDIKTKRFDYVKFLVDNSVSFDKCIFVDECGYSHLMKRGYTKLMKGPRRTRPRHKEPVVDTALCLAILPKGIVHHKTKIGKFDAATFQEFVSEISMLIDTEEYYFIMDSCKSRFGVQTENVSHKILYLPSNTPFITPIESVFSTIRQGLKAQIKVTSRPQEENSVDRKEGLMEEIERQVNDMKFENFEAIYTQCCSVYAKCLKKEDIVTE